MGLNVSASMESGFRFENKENLKNAAKNILTKAGKSEEAAQNLSQRMIMSVDKQIRDSYVNSQLAVIKASSQISMNKPLKETLKYLKSHATKKTVKQPVLGELWELFSATKQDEPDDENELMYMVIDLNAKNIFAA